MATRTCLECGSDISGKRANAIVCGNACRRRRMRKTPTGKERERASHEKWLATKPGAREKMRASYKRWSDAHPGRVKELAKEWRGRHIEQQKARMRKWATSEEGGSYHREYRNHRLCDRQSFPRTLQV